MTGATYKEQREFESRLNLLRDRVEKIEHNLYYWNSKIESLEMDDDRFSALEKKVEYLVLGIDEEEEKLKEDCLKEDLKAFLKLRRWDRDQIAKDEKDYEEKWVERWEEDPRLVNYRENRDGKADTIKPKEQKKISPRMNNWRSWVNATTLPNWFKENNVIDEASALRQRDIAIRFAADNGKKELSDGLSKISNTSTSAPKGTEQERIARLYYASFTVLCAQLRHQKILHKKLGYGKNSRNHLLYLKGDY